jgi:hypothetical protein
MSNPTISFTGRVGADPSVIGSVAYMAVYIKSYMHWRRDV